MHTNYPRDLGTILPEPSVPVAPDENDVDQQIGHDEDQAGCCDEHVEYPTTFDEAVEGVCLCII